MMAGRTMSDCRGRTEDSQHETRFPGGRRNSGKPSPQNSITFKMKKEDC